MPIKYNKHKIVQKKYFCLFSRKKIIVFQNLGQKFDIFNKTPQVREAVNHTSESLRIIVGGVLESS